MRNIQLKNRNTKKCKGKHEGNFLFPFCLSLLSFFFLFVYLKKPTGLTLGTDIPRPAQKLMILCL